MAPGGRARRRPDALAVRFLITVCYAYPFSYAHPVTLHVLVASGRIVRFPVRVAEQPGS